MLKILQARLQQYVNHELPDVQARLRKGRGTRDLITNIRWITEKAREFQKNIYFCFIDYAKAFDCADLNKLWKILKEMGISSDHLTCLLRNLYAGQEATVRTGHGTTDWFQIGKGVRQGCILSPCLFNLYAVYIMQNVGLDEAQAGIKIAGRNIKNLRYADDTILMAESEEELKKNNFFCSICSGQPFPSPRGFPNPRIEPRSPALKENSLSAEPPGKPKNTAVCSLCLLQQIFPTQESNQGLLCCRQILYQLSYQGNPLM